jgi:hypothetical protein
LKIENGERRIINFLRIGPRQSLMEIDIGRLRSNRKSQNQGSMETSRSPDFPNQF